MHLTTVLFDLDGTLLPMDQEAFTTGYFKLLAKKLAPHGYEPKSLVDAIWAGTAAMVKNDGSCTNEQAFWKKFSAIYGSEKALADQPLFEDFYANEFSAARETCGFNAAAAETVRRLKARGVRVALASSSPMDSIEEVLNACGLSDAFEYVVSGEQFKESKPEPDIYLHALDLLGLPANRCCCVEDSVPGITAGKRAGLTVIAKREERFGFSQDAADKIIDQLPDLLELA